MSTQTNKLGLFKYDPIVDKEELFDIQEALNDNWDKIDTAIVHKAGDTMTGALTLEPDSSQGYARVEKNADDGCDYGLQLQDNGDDGSFM